MLGTSQLRRDVYPSSCGCTFLFHFRLLSLPQKLMYAKFNLCRIAIEQPNPILINPPQADQTNGFFPPALSYYRSLYATDNDRGESLFNFILNSNLILWNRGNVPTFITKACQAIIDLTNSL